MKIHKDTFRCLISSLALVSITAAALILALMCISRIPVFIAMILAVILIAVWISCIIMLDVLENEKPR